MNSMKLYEQSLLEKYVQNMSKRQHQVLRDNREKLQSEKNLYMLVKGGKKII
jgi:hypothetical protein